MTKTFKRIIITAVVLIVLAGAACAVVLSGGCSSRVGSPGVTGPIDDFRNGLVNTIVDVSGVKSQADEKLRSKAGEIAKQIGVSQSTADEIVDELAIEDWKVTSLPAEANEEATYNLETDGMAARITTYDDPTIVTVDAYGQSLTMEVPESAQDYMPYLQYLEYLAG